MGDFVLEWKASRVVPDPGVGSTPRFGVICANLSARRGTSRLGVREVQFAGVGDDPARCSHSRLVTCNSRLA